MPDKILDFWTALAYAIVAVSGASGGCLVAAHHAIRGRSVTAMLLLAYAFIGGVFAVAGVAALLLFSPFQVTLERLLLIGMVLGVSGSVALAGANLSVRFLLRRLGIEIDIEVRRLDRPEKE